MQDIFAAFLQTCNFASNLFNDKSITAQNLPFISVISNMKT